MKRLITFISLIVIIILGYSLINKGFDNDKISIASYNTIEKKSEALTKKLASYDKRNQDDFESAKSTLDSSIKSFENSKAKYETIYNELKDTLEADPNSEESEVIQEVIYSDQEIYFVDSLQVTLGLYAEKNGVDVVYRVAPNSAIGLNSSVNKYFLADIQFTVTGEYINVSNYIQDLENDSTLGWEINEFAMGTGSSNGYSGVTGTFTVRNIPVDTETYLESKVQEQTTNDGTGEEQPTDGNTTNTVDGNSVSNNTVTNTTNTVSNTTNTVSNNTVN